MRRLIAMGAIALLVLAAAVPFTSASTTPVTKHVDGTIVVVESPTRTWLAKFEVRTTPAGAVQFGYLELYGTGQDQLGQIHEYTVDSVVYFRTSSGAQGARLYMQECIMIPATPCFASTYEVSDGSPDTFLANFGWEVQSGNISIYSTGGQNSQ